MRTEIEATWYRWALERVRPSTAERDASHLFDRSLWDELAGAGFFGSFAAGASPGATLEALHGLARGGLDIPFAFTAVAHLMAVVSLMRHGSPALKQRLAPSMVSGQALGAICNAEASAGTHIRNLKSRFEATRPGYGLLNAEKPFVTNAPAADVLLVSAWRADDHGQARIEVFCVEGSDVGVVQTAVSDVAGLWTGLTGHVAVKGLELATTERLLGGAGTGVKLLKEAFDLERLLVPAVVAGALAGLVDDAMAHAQRTKAFGKPLAEFQYIQEKIVTLYRTSLALTALVGHVVARGFDFHGPYPDQNAELAALKMAAADDGLAAAIGYYEILGAAGYTRSSICQKIIRDLLAIKALGGTKELQKNVIFDQLARDAAAQIAPAAPKVA